MDEIIGKIFLDRFRVDAFIASGGMGAVYRAWDLERGATLAMKILHAERMDDPGAYKYFKREANALKQLRHPNIVPFYGLYQTEECVFFLEQYIDGPSLHRILRKQTSGLPLPETLGYMQALCSALGYAHKNGVVHCDIKPGNVMVDKGGQIYLTDFGIARHAESVTTTIAGAGTPAYMSPEQIRAEPVTPAADIYTLGVLLFELSTGRRPFRGDEAETTGKGSTTGERIRYAHLHLPPPDPSRLNPALPSVLARIIAKCMAKSPQDRYASTQDLWMDLQGLGIQANQRAQYDIPTRPVFAASAPTSGDIKSKQPGKAAEAHLLQSRSKWIWIGGAITLVAGFILTIIVGMTIFTPHIVFPPRQPIIHTALAASTTTAGINLPTNTVTATVSLPPTLTATLVPSTPPPVTREPSAGATAISAVDGMTMVYVPAGEFIMGSYVDDPNAKEDEFPQHVVYLDAFWVDKYEITNAMFAHFVESTHYQTQAETAGWSWDFDGENWSKQKGTNWRHPLNASQGLNGLENHPVVRVSHADAQAYCRWSGRRLLTEAEWERAARGEEGRTYPWGDLFLCGHANFFEPGCDSYTHTAPVGSFSNGSSPDGILDMAGNVWEWVADWYQEDYYMFAPYNNPQGPGSGEGYVMRGGSWSTSETSWFRASFREWGNENDSYWSTGFRCGSSDAP